jgi:hypothetical protein
MQDPRDTNEKSTAPTTESTNPSKQINIGTAEVSSALPRRLLFSGGLLGLISQACSRADFTSAAAGNSLRKNAAPVIANPGAMGSAQDTGTVAPAALPPEIPTMDAGTACRAIDNPKLNIETVPMALAEKMPTAVFYGQQKSALLAMLLPEGEDIRSVVVCTANGKLMALHGITSADKKSNGNWRPIVIDNLPLIDKGAGLNEIVVLMQINGKTVKSNIPVSFMDRFQNKSVIDFSDHTVPAGMIGNQSVTQFKEGRGTFNVDENEVYPNKYNSTQVRNLQTAKSGTTWTKGDRIVGTVFTDVMGRVLDTLDGSTILEHQVFCTYKETSDGKWARTMLHIG